MTKTAEAARDNSCFFFATEVTSMFIRSSMLLLPKSFGASCGQAGIVIRTAAAKLRQPRLRTLRFPFVTAVGTGRFVLSISDNLTLIVPLPGCAKPFQMLFSGFKLL